MVWTIKQALSTGLRVSASAVISNHGEWTRLGGKEPITTAGDNASTHLARQVKRLVDEINARPAAQRVDALKTRHTFKTEFDEEARKAAQKQADAR